MEQRRNVQYWATFAVAISTMTASVAFSWTTPVIHKFRNNETNIHLSDTEISWLVASLSPGLVIGCLLSRYPIERFGRRATLLGSAFPFIIGTIFVVTATKSWMLCMAKFCWGLGVGLIQSVSMIYISEIAAKEIRGSLSVFNRFMFTFGAFLVIAVGSKVSYQTLSYMLIVLPVCYFGACWWIPETPYYLLKEGKVDAARKALMKLNGYTDDKISDEKLTEIQSHVKEEMLRSGTVREFLTGKQYQKAIIISIGLRTTQMLSGLVPLQQYLGTILLDRGLAISVSTALIIFGAVRFTSSIVASQIIDKVGRRVLLICSYAGASLTLLSLGTLFFFHEVMNKTPSYFGYVVLCGAILLTTVSTLGFDTLSYVIPAEIFPLNVKSLAITCLNIYASVIVFFVLKGYQTLKDFSGLYGVFWCFGMSAFAGAIFSYVAIPETRGKSLREIQLEIQGDLHVNEDNEKLNKDLTKVTENNKINDIDECDESSRLKA